MNFRVVIQPAYETTGDMVIIPYFEDNEQQLSAQNFGTATVNNVAVLMRDGEVTGKFGSTTVIHNFESAGTKKTLVIGAGKKSDFCCDKIRQLAATALQQCQKCRAVKVVFPLSDMPAVAGIDHASAAQALAEGALMGLYTFDMYKSRQEGRKTPIEEIILTEINDRTVDLIKQGIHNGKIMAEAANLARDLVNHPGNFMTPGILADRATRVAETTGLQISVLERHDIEREGMGGLLAVSQGSVEHPKLIVMKYTGAPQADTIALIGKGLTFDSGGISIKPSEGMGEMKADMAGGAAVIGAMLAIGRLKPQTNVLGIIPATENMPGGRALKPGDIITSLAGKTIEIITTDAEGRLILADAITYAKQLGAVKIVDIATLTGACVVALGTVTSGVVSNNHSWCQALLRAAAQTGEKMWELPGYEEYREQIKGTLADLKNSGGRPAGAITAGLFLSEFAADTPWTHIDIAGTASLEKPKGYNLKGATGVATRTLVQLVLNAGC